MAESLPVSIRLFPGGNGSGLLFCPLSNQSFSPIYIYPPLPLLPPSFSLVFFPLHRQGSWSRGAPTLRSPCNVGPLRTEVVMAATTTKSLLKKLGILPTPGGLPVLTEVELQNKHITAQDARKLCKALTSNNTITCLKVGCNELSDEVSSGWRVPLYLGGVGKIFRPTPTTAYHSFLLVVVVVVLSREPRR